MYGKKARAAQAAAIRLNVSKTGSLRVVLVGKEVLLAPVCRILQHSMMQWSDKACLKTVLCQVAYLCGQDMPCPSAYYQGKDCAETGGNNIQIETGVEPRLGFIPNLQIRRVRSVTSGLS